MDEAKDAYFCPPATLPGDVRRQGMKLSSLSIDLFTAGCLIQNTLKRVSEPLAVSGRINIAESVNIRRPEPAKQRTRD
ncbi:unnamed protein product [Dibothriocephalus latus]|uniref:Uncharacterized protein n=1 Tax=Dibothriocephalus latus TaxID=60516 RepID=A0A3P7P7W4_DIBLA|nr:unnamed protein product [Dibothriocephalus latus]